MAERLGVFILPSQEGPLDPALVQLLSADARRLPDVCHVEVLADAALPDPERLAAELAARELSGIVLAGPRPGYYKAAFKRALAFARGEPARVRLASFREFGSRMNVSNGMSTPRAEEARQEMFAALGSKPSGAMLGQHWARLVEMLHAAEKIRAYTADPAITGDDLRRIPDGVSSEGVGIVEAMRGTLTHHYTCDERGVCTSANPIVGTTNNNAAIHMLTQNVAASVIVPGREPTPGILDRIEMAFRAFDPCYSCATHSVPGRMPLHVRLHRDGRVWREFRREP